MTVSVIIPVYNRTALLCDTLESVFAQTFRDYELIVVDDGSEEDIRAALAGTGRPVVYRRTAHAGQGAARNQGLAHARGELIAFLDSDDLWAPAWIEKLAGALEANPNAGFAYCDYATFDEGCVQRATNLLLGEKMDGDLFPALLRSNFLCTGTLLFRRDCLTRTGGFDPQLPPVEDWDLWLRIAHEFTALYVDESLVRIRLDATHESRNPLVVYPLNLRILDRVRRAFPQDALRHGRLLRAETRYFHRALARAYRAEGQPLRAIRHLVQSMRPW